MTFNDNANLDGGGGDLVKKRGRGTAVAVGGGLTVIALFILSQLLGVNLTGLAGGGQQQQQQTQTTDESLDHCKTGADANEYVDCRMKGVAASLDAFWEVELPKFNVAYTQPSAVELFSGSIQTGCGAASSATGPFYCPGDQAIYIDVDFFDELRDRFGSSGGPLAQMYVVAHEWGHHIQNITGILQKYSDQQTGDGSNQVRIELQADCFAGAWTAAASQTEDENGVALFEPVTDDDIRDALSAAEAVGDDRIQQATQGQVTPHTWTHGSSQQRQNWFLTGYKKGADACDTFGADSL